MYEHQPLALVCMVWSSYGDETLVLNECVLWLPRCAEIWRVIQCIWSHSSAL